MVQKRNLASKVVAAGGRIGDARDDRQPQSRLETRISFRDASPLAVRQGRFSASEQSNAAIHLSRLRINTYQLRRFTSMSHLSWPGGFAFPNLRSVARSAIPIHLCALSQYHLALIVPEAFFPCLSVCMSRSPRSCKIRPRYSGAGSIAGRQSF